MNIDEEIKQLSYQVDMAMKFESYDEEEEYKKNKSSKNDVLRFILEKHNELKKKGISHTEFVKLFNKCILILVSNTGCSEDLEILEEILDELYNKGLINSVTYKEIIDKSNLGRWIE